MIAAELQAFARHIELKTRRMLSGIAINNYKATSKGTGLEFDQLRDYCLGDDIRYIDWKSTARSGRMLVRQYFQERNRTVILVVDCSASVYYGSTPVLKVALQAELASIMAFVAFFCNYSLGLVLVSDDVEVFMPARLSREQCMHIVNTLVSYTPQGKNSNIARGLEMVMTQQKKNALIALFSDFLDDLNPAVLAAVQNRHEVIAFRCLDNCEYNLPEALLSMQDSETGMCQVYTTSALTSELALWHSKQEQLLRRYGISCFTALVGQEYTPTLAQFLRYRVCSLI